MFGELRRKCRLEPPSQQRDPLLPRILEEMIEHGALVSWRCAHLQHFTGSASARVVDEPSGDRARIVLDHEGTDRTLITMTG